MNPFQRASKCSFQNSLLLLILLGISKEIRDDMNTYYTAQHFKNDPRQNPDERWLHYIESGAAKRFIEKFKREHPELVHQPGEKLRQARLKQAA